MARVGEAVRVRGGQLDGLVGRVSSVDEAADMAVVLVRIFGRDTPVDVAVADLDDAPEMTREAPQSPDPADPTSILDEQG